MSESQVAALRDAVLAVLQRAPEQRLLGAMLGNQVRTLIGRTAKDLGFANLGDFVRQNLETEVRVTHGEKDLVFQLEPAGGAAVRPPALGSDAQTPTIQPDLRKIWKNPSSPLTLRVRVADGEVRALSQDVPCAEGEVALQSPTADLHKNLGREFLQERMSEEERVPFEEKIASSGPWWQEWDKLFRAPGPDLRIDWLRFREKRLMEALEAALREKGLTEGAFRHALDVIHRSRIVPRKSESMPPSGGRESLRAALISTLQAMSEDELRRVWVPAGLLADALLRGH